MKTTLPPMAELAVRGLLVLLRQEGHDARGIRHALGH
jgi:hypothetical protein